MKLYKIYDFKLCRVPRTGEGGGRAVRSVPIPARFQMGREKPGSPLRQQKVHPFSALNFSQKRDKIIMKEK